MKFKLFLLVVLLGVLGGGAYGVRTYMRNADPAVRAERMAAEGRLRDALVEYRTASRNNPKDAELHVKIGQVQSKLADPVAAEKEFRTAIQLGADRNVVMPLLGESVLVQGRYRDVLREVPTRGPDTGTLARNLQLRALAQLALDDVPAAQATLRDAEARVPGTAEVALVAARVAAARNEPDVMRAKVAEVLKLDPNQVEALLMEEKMRTLEGDRAGAMSLADRAVKAAPWSAMARIERANQFIYAGDDKQAQADVNAVLQAQPRFMDAVYLNGILMARRGELAEAAAQLEKLDAVSARMPQGLYYQSLIAAQQGNVQTAAEFARRYNTIVPRDPDGMRQLARVELALNRPGSALPLLQRLAAAFPKDAEVFDMLGRAHASLEQGPDAFKALSTAVELAPEVAAYRYHLGAQQLQVGQPARALPELEKAFAADPKIPGLGNALTSAALATGDVAKAEATLAKLRGAVGDTDETAQLAAAIKVRANDLPGARTVLTEAARKYPNSIELRLQLALLLVRQGQAGDAVPLLSAILVKEPARMPALAAFIRIKADENDLPAAIAALETARRASPRNAVVTTMLADALVASGDARRAVEVLTEGGADTALPALTSGALGRAQLAAGRPEDAKATYRRVLAEHPEDLLVRGALATLMNNDRDFEGVRALLLDGLARLPGNYSLMSGLVANEMRWKGVEPAASYADQLRSQPNAMPFGAALKGDMFMSADRAGDASRAYLVEYNASPSLPMLLKTTGAMALSRQEDAATALILAWLKDHPADAEAAQRLAQIDIQAGRFAAAQEHLGIVLASQPSNATALNNLAWSYLQTGDQRALATAQKAYLQEPSALSGDTLGWILVKTGSAKTAIPLLQRAAGMRPGDRGIQYHLGAALAEDGRSGEALAVLQPLLEGAAFGDQEAARKLAGELRGK